MQHSMTKMITTLESIFNEKKCYKLARECGFIKRSSSRLNGHEYLKLFAISSHETADNSLDGLCEQLQSLNPKAILSAPALAQRINTPSAVEFMEICFSKLIQLCRKCRRSYWIYVARVFKA